MPSGKGDRYLPGGLGACQPVTELDLMADSSSLFSTTM